MRHEPHQKYNCFPCSVVGTGTAYEYLTGKEFPMTMPKGINPDGYLPLKDEDAYIRQFLTVKKKKYFQRKERITLSEFLNNNKDAVAVCVLGHFIFVDGSDYWSFFNNECDMVVCAWYLERENNNESN